MTSAAFTPRNAAPDKPARLPSPSAVGAERSRSAPFLEPPTEEPLAPALDDCCEPSPAPTPSRLPTRSAPPASADGPCGGGMTAVVSWSSSEPVCRKCLNERPASMLFRSRCAPPGSAPPGRLVPPAPDLAAAPAPAVPCPARPLTAGKVDFANCVLCARGDDGSPSSSDWSSRGTRVPSA